MASPSESARHVARSNGKLISIAFLPGHKLPAGQPASHRAATRRSLPSHSASQREASLSTLRYLLRTMIAARSLRPLGGPVVIVVIVVAAATATVAADTNGSFRELASADDGQLRSIQRRVASSRKSARHSCCRRRLRPVCLLLLVRRAKLAPLALCACAARGICEP